MEKKKALDIMTIIGWIVAGIAALFGLYKQFAPKLVTASIEKERRKLEATIKDTSDTREFQQKLLESQQVYYQSQSDNMIKLLESSEQFIKDVIYEKLENIEKKIGQQESTIAVFRDEFSLMITEMRKVRNSISAICEHSQVANCEVKNDK